MNIALLGYGKMGKAIEKVALSRGHSIAFKVNQRFDARSLEGVDVAIEFSVPNAVIDNIKCCFAVNTPIVVGTTGWYNQFDNVKKECLTQEQALFYATNFSIGVNVFWEINKKLADLMNQHEDYEVSMKEIHHIHKLDSPSGTAITTANQILNRLQRKTSWIEGSSSKDQIEIITEREGEVPGTHTVNYESEIDKIEITHKANNRQGFALGAVLAAEWLVGRQGVFTMKDMLKF